MEFLTDNDLEILAARIEEGNFRTVEIPSRMGFDRANISPTRPLQMRVLEPESVYNTLRRGDDGKIVPDAVYDEHDAFSKLTMLADNIISKRNMNIPGRLDGTAGKDDTTWSQRIISQFIRQASATSHRTFVQTGNASMASRAFDIAFFTMVGITQRYIREVLKGNDEAYLEQLQEKPITTTLDALAWTGAFGVLGDKLFGSLSGIIAGESSYSARQQIEFAITPPIVGAGKMLGAGLASVPKLFTGEDMTDYEKRSWRKILTFGMADSAAMDLFRLVGDDLITPEDSALDDVWDALFPDLEDKEGILEKIRN
jgi:hypothetical protein